jgi:hypothetical protein
MDFQIDMMPFLKPIKKLSPNSSTLEKKIGDDGIIVLPTQTDIDLQMNTIAHTLNWLSI